jgi:DNA-directed RNA polymerase subunit beta'
MPKLQDFNEFCENMMEITTYKILDKKHFHSKGLFSEQIFGPISNYTCQCGIYHGASRDGGICDECGVDIVNSDERRRRFAKIVLPIPVVNPIFYDLVVNIAGKQVKGALDDLMKKDKSVLYIEDDDFIVTSEENVPEGEDTYERLEAIYMLVEGLAKVLSNEGLSDWKLIYDNLDKLFLKEIAVLPPDLRPASKGADKNSRYVDKINRFYVQLLNKKEIMQETMINVSQDKSLFYNYFRQLQSDVNELYDYIIKKLSKKEGLIRGNILGKRIDFSGRAVIIPDPTINLDECILPYLMFMELFKIQIAKKLIEINSFNTFNESIDFINECIEFKVPKLFELCEELAIGEVCLLNRQPSLHRLSMLGFKIKVSLDEVIKIHPLACPPFNADFDGDQMAVYIPVSEESKQEILNRFLITKNFTNPANSSLSTTPSQDIILGVYMLTLDKFPELSSEIEYKGEKLSGGKILFNECLPEDFRVVKDVISEGKLIKILNEIKKKYDYKIVTKTLDDIKRLGFKYSTLFGATMSLESCRIAEATDLRKKLYKGSNIREQLTLVSSDETQNFMKEKFNYSYFIESGARGSWDQVRQIVLTRGFISNFDGQIIPEPIKHSFLNGLTPKEFFDSTYGSRKGLLDVALNTGTSGYLSRKLIFTCANLVLDLECEDCGTEDLLEVYVENDKKSKMLIDRWMKDGDSLVRITRANCNSIVKKTIYIRSPIYCKNPDICLKCYGDLYTSLDSKFVGFIAAQSLGETNTQLVLRTFHTSGVAVIKDVKEETEEKDDKLKEMKQMDIVNDLSVASSLLHKFKNQTPVKLTHDLYKVYNSSRSINHIHIECVVAQLMWNGYKKWRLFENRDETSVEFHSVQTVPALESWLLALAFSNPKKSILKGLLYDGNYSGIMDKILKGERI